MKLINFKKLPPVGNSAGVFILFSENYQGCGVMGVTTPNLYPQSRRK